LFGKLKSIFGFGNSDEPVDNSQSDPATPNFYVEPPNRYTGKCLCGCRGKKWTFERQSQIDIELYKFCSARLARKENTKLRKAYQKEKRLKAAWGYRHIQSQPARSAKEAKFRDLRTFDGKKCSKCSSKIKNKHGFCWDCAKVNNKLRDAMKRGAYPEDLTQRERKEILEIYEKCKRVTRETGVEHHVDHIKPLARGGRHHPSNLQIITAAENLKKGAKWAEVN